jgi:hypothetical protein
LEFKLYQVKLVLTREFGFIGFVQLESFSMDNYDLLYEGEVQGKDDIDALDNLFRKFNLNHPERLCWTLDVGKRCPVCAATAPLLTSN